MNSKSVLSTFCALFVLILYKTCTVDSSASVSGDTLCPVKKRTINLLPAVFKEESKFLRVLGLVKNNRSKTAEMIQIEVLECLHGETDKKTADDGQCAFDNLATKFTTSYKSRCVQQYQTILVPIHRNETTSEVTYEFFPIPSGCKCHFFERT